MRIAFVIARVGEEMNIIQKLSLILADELRKFNDVVDIFPFKRKTVFSFRPYRNFKYYDCVLIANVGLQCAYYSLFKRLGLIKKPFVAISFGSDIRATDNRWINLFNRISKPAVDLLIVTNPDLKEIAEKRGYASVKYVHSWSSELA
jgi:hypothetical protein